MRRLGVALAILLSLGAWHGWHGTGGTPAHAVCHIATSPAQPAVSNLTFPSGSGAGVTIGAVSVTSSGECSGSPTLSITGTNTGGFTLSGSSAPANLLTASGSSAACGSGCSVTVQADFTGANNTPQSHTVTITTNTPVGAVALQRTLSGTGGATAFGCLGQPFGAPNQATGVDDVPAGNILTATLGGTTIPIGVMERKLSASGSLMHATICYDASGISLPAALKFSYSASASTDESFSGYITTVGAPQQFQALLYVTTPGAGAIQINDQITCSGCAASYVVSNPNSGSPYVVSVPQIKGSSGSPISITATTTNWPSTTTRTTADVTALVDTVALSSLGSVTKTSASTGTSSATLTFGAGSPIGNTGMIVNDLTNPAAITGGTTVLSRAGTTIVMSANAAATVASGDYISVSSSGARDEPDIIGSGAWDANCDGGPQSTLTVIDTSPVAALIKCIVHPIDHTSLSASGSWAGGTETVTATAHGMLVGDQVVLAGSPSVTCKVATASANSFTCPIGSNPGAITSTTPFNRHLTVAIYYRVFEKADTTLGPIASEGPFIRNTQIHLVDTNLNSSKTALSYAATFARNGSCPRALSAQCSYTGFIADGAWGNLTRPGDPTVLGDLYDWTASDPAIGVTQNYSQVVATNLVPPFVPGVTGYGADLVNALVRAQATMTSIAGAVWAVDYIDGIYGNSGVYYPQPVVVTSTGSIPTGLTAGATYYAVHTTTTHLELYDNFYHAIAAGATGLVTPSDSGSGTVTLTQVSAPNATGHGRLGLDFPGADACLSVTCEYGAAYLVGNNALWQHLGLTQAYDEATLPLQGLEASTGLPPNLLPVSLTPPGMGGSFHNAAWNIGTMSVVNGGVTPPGLTAGGWVLSGSVPQHQPNPIWIPWLLTGSDALADLQIEKGDGSISPGYSTRDAISGRYVLQTCIYFSDRRGAWTTRNFMQAGFVAPQGSPVETYFRAIDWQNLDYCNYYTQTYKGANYAATGLLSYDELTVPPTVIAAPEVAPFMQAFMLSTVGMMTKVEGSYFPAALTFETWMSKWLTASLGADGEGISPFLATAFSETLSNSGWGDASPGAYENSNTLIKYNPQELVTFYRNGSSTVTLGCGTGTWTTTGCPDPWSGKDASATILSNDDQVCPVNYDTQQASINAVPGTPAPPTPLAVGTCYYVVGISGATPSLVTFGLAATSGGSPISMTSLAVGAKTTTTSAPTSAGNPTITVVTGAGITKGMIVEDVTNPTAIASPVSVVSVAGSVVTLSANVAAPGVSSGDTITFSPGVQTWWRPGPTKTYPSAGVVTGNTREKSYLYNWGMSAAICADLGIANCAAAWTNYNARQTGTPANEMDWAGAPQ